MSTVLANASLTPTIGLRPRSVWLILAATQLVSALAAAQYGWYWAGAPLCLLIVGSIMADPRIGFYVLFLALFFEAPLPGPFRLYVADIVVFIVIASTAAHQLLRGRPLIRHSSINRILGLLLVIFGISMLGEHNLGKGVVNWFRHVEMFGLLVAVVTCLEREEILRLLKWFLFLTAVFSLINIATYLALGGGQRIFGPAGQHFERFVVVLSMHAAVGFLISRRSHAMLGWGILFMIYSLALLFTQTRVAMVQVTLGLLFLISFLWLYSRRQGYSFIRRRIAVLSVCFAIFVVLVVMAAAPFLEMPSERIAEVFEGRAQTLNYRIFLWTTGLRAFAGSPILGIGLGQVSSWSDFLSFWRWGRFSTATKGLSAHNDFITYLAETGMVGIIPILFLFWKLFKRGPQTLRYARRLESVYPILILWIPVTTISIGFFFSYALFWSISGMMTMLYLGMWVRYSDSLLAEAMSGHGSGASL